MTVRESLQTVTATCRTMIDLDAVVYHSYGYEVKAAQVNHTQTALTPIVTIKPQGDREIANAHLIAAAPAMYEALQTLVEYLSAQVPADTLDDWKHVFAARQALAQAEGKHS